MIDITVLENRLHLVCGYKVIIQFGEDIKKSLLGQGADGGV